jgi:hypothetical protein
MRCLQREKKTCLEDDYKVLFKKWAAKLGSLGLNLFSHTLSVQPHMLPAFFDYSIAYVRGPTATG